MTRRTDLLYYIDHLESHIVATSDLIRACKLLSSAVRNLEGQPIQYSLAIDLLAALKECDIAIAKAEGQ